MTAVPETFTEEAERFAPIEGVEWATCDNAWKSETRLELVAWELARYEPELAMRIAEAGIRRLQMPMSAG